jgi:hypothetical protein
MESKAISNSGLLRNLLSTVSALNIELSSRELLTAHFNLFLNAADCRKVDISFCIDLLQK